MSDGLLLTKGESVVTQDSVARRRHTRIKNEETSFEERGLWAASEISQVSFAQRLLSCRVHMNGVLSWVF